MTWTHLVMQIQWSLQCTKVRDCHIMIYERGEIKKAKQRKRTEAPKNGSWTFLQTPGRVVLMLLYVTRLLAWFVQGTAWQYNRWLIANHGSHGASGKEAQRWLWEWERWIGLPEPCTPGKWIIIPQTYEHNFRHWSIMIFFDRLFHEYFDPKGLSV